MDYIDVNDALLTKPGSTVKTLPLGGKTGQGYTGLSGP